MFFSIDYANKHLFHPANIFITKMKSINLFFKQQFLRININKFKLSDQNCGIKCYSRVPLSRTCTSRTYFPVPRDLITVVTQTIIRKNIEKF